MSSVELKFGNTTTELTHIAGETNLKNFDMKSLNQGVAVTAATAYAIADSAQPFAPHLTAAEVQTMLKKANELDNYNALKSMDWVP